MAGKPIGTIFVELDLDASRYTRAQQSLVRDATSTSLSIEDNFRKLGIKSSASFDLMRVKAVNAFDMIASSSKATANDILRAEEAKNAQLNKLNEQQFGKQTSSLDNIKTKWLGIAAVAYAAYETIAKGFELVKIAAAAEQAEASFRAVASSAGESADGIISAMKRATAGTVDDSDMMQKAVKGMLAGLSGEDMTKIAEMSRLAARTMGTDVAASFDMIADSVSTKMPRALRQAGLITQEQMKIISEAISAGVEDVDLLSIAYENFLRQQERMGPLTTNATEEIQKLNAQWASFKETLGTTMISVIMGLVHPLDTVTKSIKNQTGELGYLTDEFGRLYKLPKSMAATASDGGAMTAPSSTAISPEPSETRFTPNYLASRETGYLKQLKEDTMRGKVNFDALVREGIVNKADVPALIEKFAGKDKDWQKYITDRKQNIADLQNILKAVETVQSGKQGLLQIEDAAFNKKLSNADKVKAIEEKTYAYLQNKTLAYYNEDARLSELKSRAMDATGDRQIKLLDDYIAKAGEIASKYGTEGAGGITGRSIMMDMASGIEQAARMQQDAYSEIETNQKQKIRSDEAMLANIMTNINDVKVEIEGMYNTLDQPMNITINTDEAMTKIRQVQEAINSLIIKGSKITTITTGATGGATVPQSGFDYNAEIPEATMPTYEAEKATISEEPIPITYEPEIVMSPAVPFAEGVANMQDMLSGLGDSMSGAMDLSQVSNMITAMSGLAKRIEQQGSISEMWSATPGYKRRAAFEVKQYEELYNLGIQALRGEGSSARGSRGVDRDSGKGNVTITIETINVTGSGDLAKDLDKAIAQEIKYGRSAILTAIQAYQS